MKNFFYCLAILITSCFSLRAVAQNSSEESLDLSYKVYQQVKSELAAEESAYGGFLTTSNVRMHYLDRGPKDGITLLWAHGSEFSAHELDQIVDDLTSDGIRVITIDYVGHGLTPIPKHPVSIFHVADDMRALLDHLRIEETIVGGWSRGGTIATAFYQTFPERALGVILEDGGSEKWTRAYAHSIGGYIASKPDVYEPTGYPSEYELVKALVANQNSIVNQGRAHQMLAKGFEEASDGLWYNQADLLRWMWEDTTEHCEAWLSASHESPLFQTSTVHNEPKIAYRNLTVPLLIFDPVSDDDFHNLTPGNEWLKDRYPDLVTHLIYEDTNHWVHFSQPERFARDIISFVRALPSGR